MEVNLESTPASDLVDLTLHGPAERLLAEGRRCSAPLPRLVPFERTRTASEGIEVIPNGLDLPHPVVVELLEERAW